MEKLLEDLSFEAYQSGTRVLIDRNGVLEKLSSSGGPTVAVYIIVLVVNP
jgi:hypothetical protein